MPYHWRWWLDKRPERLVWVYHPKCWCNSLHDFVKISCEPVHHIIHFNLEVKQICAKFWRWSCVFNPRYPGWSLLVFLGSINEKESMEWRLSASPKPKKFRESQIRFIFNKFATKNYGKNVQNCSVFAGFSPTIVCFIKC